MKSLLLVGVTHLQSLVVVVVEGVKRLGIVGYHVDERLALIGIVGSLLGLVKHLGVERLNGASHHLHHVAQVIVPLAVKAVLDGIALDEVFLQHGVGPSTELYATFRFYSIAHRRNHLQIIIVCHVGLRLAFQSTMLSGCRKFCDNHFALQFLLERIVDVLTNSFHIAVEQCSYLITVQPHRLVLQSHVDGRLPVLQLINLYLAFTIHG